MLHEDVLIAVAAAMKEHGSMKLMEIYKTLSKQDEGLRYTEIEQVIRANVRSDKAIFKRLTKGLYCFQDCSQDDKEIVVQQEKNARPNFAKLQNIKTRERLRGFVVSDNNKKEVISTGQAFKVEGNLGFLKHISINVAEKFKQDVDEVFSEAISIAYDQKERYDCRKGSPTTFILTNIAPRLRNEVIRRFVPTISKLVHIENPDGTIKKESKRIVIPHCSLSGKICGKNNSETFDYELIDVIDDENLLGGFSRAEIRPDRQLEEADRCEKIQTVLKNAKMSSNEVIVIQKKFGLDGSKERTLQEVGEEINMTKERVRQILESGLGKLRKNRGMQELVA